MITPIDDNLPFFGQARSALKKPAALELITKTATKTPVEFNRPTPTSGPVTTRIISSPRESTPGAMPFIGPNGPQQAAVDVIPTTQNVPVIEETTPMSTTATVTTEQPLGYFVSDHPWFSQARPVPSETPAMADAWNPHSANHDEGVSKATRISPSSSSTVTPITSESPMFARPLTGSAGSSEESSTSVSSARDASTPASKEAASVLRKVVSARSPSTVFKAAPIATSHEEDVENGSLRNSMTNNIMRYFFSDPPESAVAEAKNATAAGLVTETVVTVPGLVTGGLVHPLADGNRMPNEVIVVPPQKSKAEPDKDKDHLEHSESMRTLTIVGKRSHITTIYRDHCHFERHGEGVDKMAKRKLIVASVLCLCFMICEIIGGIFSRSLAIATDAAHLLTDLAGFLISLFAIHLSARPSTQRMNFGWHRAEVIGAMISVYFIWVITGILVWLAVERLISNQHDVDAKIMLITSALAILVNLVMAIQLTHGHSHDAGRAQRQPRFPVPASTSKASALNATHGEPQLMPASVSQYAHAPKDNINVRAAIIHVFGDMIQSVGVFVAACIIFFKPEWSFVDSICTFIFSIIVLLVTFRILRDVLMVLMEATPDYMDYGEVQRTFLSIQGVEHVHNLRIWALSINKVALAAHLAIGKDADPQIILDQATTLIHKHYNFFETTIQIEGYTAGMEDCKQCLTPGKSQPNDKNDNENGDENNKKMQENTKNGNQYSA
ncbi:uncharacterized protein LOC116805218 [Drosophila grimshawi]|uniref:uncharacterized protein LOC116805218 n=1 Tax=Drosophila grimshawi TaxID=7222 RepID=UPI001C934E46|nr:uncharacterized protein LOC116805218 [Drosophila grimshawi]